MARATINEGVLDGVAVSTIPFGMVVNMGLAPGFSNMDKFGANAIISTASDPEDIVEQGGEIVYDANGTAPIRYLSSSSASDVGLLAFIDGLDIEGNRTQQIATCNGQTNVELDIPLWRCFRIFTGFGPNDAQGIIYVHTDPSPSNGVPSTENIRVVVNGAKNQSLYGALTVPKGKVGMLHAGEVGIFLEGNAASLAEYALAAYKSRRYGENFSIKKEFSLIVGGSNVYQDKRTFTDTVPALTDIKVTIEEVSQTMGAWATLDIQFIDENKFTKARLQEIGQPGY